MGATDAIATKNRIEPVGKKRQQPKRRGQLARALPLLTIACLATCALAGLAVGVYDIAYTSVNFEVPSSSEVVLGR